MLLHKSATKSNKKYTREGGGIMPIYLLDNEFSTMINPIVDLINSALGPIIALVVAVGAIYCIVLGLKLAKAEEPQDREKAKTHLKNAIIGFLLIFVLVAALKLGLNPMIQWMNDKAGTKVETTTTSTKTG
jgi:hypothetical protein